MRLTAALNRSATLGLLLGGALALGGCGDKPSEGPGYGPTGVPTSLPSGVGEDAAARFKAAMEARAKANGTTLPPGAAEEISAQLKAAIEARIKDGRPASLPMAFEPLKASEVELWLKLAPSVNKLGGDLPAITKALEGEGLTAMQWVMLQSRVTGTALGLKTGKMPEQLKPSADVVAPYLDRILSTLNMR